MFLRLLLESFLRQRRRKLLAGIAILLGATAVTAMLGLATTIGDRIHQELAVYGANIIVYPKADTLDVKVGDQSLKPATGNAYLHESDLAKLRSIFWANNITGVSPELRAQMGLQTKAVPDGVGVDAIGLWFDHSLSAGGGPALITGAPMLHPSWKLEGAWPQEENIVSSDNREELHSDVVVGASVARRLNLHVGDTLLTIISVPHSDDSFKPPNVGLRVSGIVSTGDITDAQILLPISVVQQIANHPDAVSRIEISARTKPEDAFARRDPDTLSPQQHEIWYCRPYANSIAYQIAEAIPGAHAEQVRQVEQSEGTILERISGLMWLISAAALLAAAVAVSAAMATAVLERRAEIGLMRSLGASKGRIASLFYAEAGLLAIGGGFCGYIAGSLLAALLTAKIFGEPTGITLHTALTHAFNPVLLPVVLALALLVAIAGSTASIRGALRMDPSAVLRADA
ncbi:MAG TPA: FtsX-like permease family protein [Acidobacteriaceae bacterium]|nr:FtsX-like permease family protein [Acidobacteriaceae bacterium]